MPQHSPPDHISDGQDATHVKRATTAMEEYETYVDELSVRLPGSFDRLNRFLTRGNCKSKNRQCCHHIGTLACTCINTAGNFVSPHPSQLLCQGCKTIKLEDTVRIYSINPEEKSWDRLFDAQEYHASDSEDFRKLQARLYGNEFERTDPSDHLEPEFNESLDDPPIERACSIITVNHLSPQVAKLLGARFGISADFFNRHLPGTETISGRQISRLPSAVQIDFDELYESNLEFRDIYPNIKTKTQEGVAIQGHEQIKQSIDQHLLFPVGWDYFPISERDWQGSITNVEVKSGFEVPISDQEVDLKNVFQFNLRHRISIFSDPVGYPRTSIIIFNPVLPFHVSTPRKDGPPPQCLSKCSLHGESDIIRFRSIPNAIPTPGEWRTIGLSDWERDERKQSYASAYDIILRQQLQDCLTARTTPRAHERRDLTNLLQNITAQNTSRTTKFDSFIRVFSAPLFRLVSANWARLAVRLSFDLDSLERRSSKCLDSTTVEEVRSRRVAITRHQRDISASLGILHALGSTETGTKLEKVHESLRTINLRRPNGFVANAEKDSWNGIYWEFYELKASMDALEKRATKIHESILGMIGIVNSENNRASNKHSCTLITATLVFTTILLPFIIVPSIFNSLDGKGGPSITVSAFSKAIEIAVVADGLFVILSIFFDTACCEPLCRRRPFQYISGKSTRFYTRHVKVFNEVED